MGKYQIQRWQQTITIADGDDTSDTTADLNGLLKGIIVDVPDLTSTDTITCAISDADGYTVFSIDSIAKSSVSINFVDGNNFPYDLPLSGSHTIAVTSSGTEGADRDIKVTLLIDRS